MCTDVQGEHYVVRKNELLRSKMQTAKEKFDAETIANDVLQQFLANCTNDIDFETIEQVKVIEKEGDAFK